MSMQFIAITATAVFLAMTGASIISEGTSGVADDIRANMGLDIGAPDAKFVKVAW